jgi:acyl carrier protein
MIARGPNQRIDRAIEAALAKLPGVRGVVICEPDRDEDSPGLTAYVLVDQTRTPLGRLRAALVGTVAAASIPRRFVAVDEIAIDADGGVNTAALAQASVDTIEFASSFTPAADATEIALSAIWRDALNVDPVGVDDNFFLLGGDSLKAIEILARIKDTWNVHVPVAALFEQPTVRTLARIIGERARHTQEEADYELGRR